jgi:hypothetical protein
MINLTGEGVLALWNSVEPPRASEYNAWHTREHVPERLSVPGMLGARRYVKLGGPLPEYLTLYSMDTVDVLRSAPYRRLLENPTSWSRSMRDSLRDFFRMACRRVMSAGGGLGGVAAAYLLADNELRSPVLQSQLQALVQTQGIVAVHLLARDHNIPDVPFQPGGERPNFPDGGVILLESYDSDELTRSLQQADQLFRNEALNDTEKVATIYRLAYAIDAVSLERLIPITQPASP